MNRFFFVPENRNFVLKKNSLIPFYFLSTLNTVVLLYNETMSKM